jgi:hypothetical protein
MRALTLWQPWASAVATRRKPIENRSWAPPRNLIGQPFALHAGKHWDDRATLICGIDPRASDLLPIDDDILEIRGAVIGIATIDRVIVPDAALGTDEHVDALTDLQRLWYSGSYGWVLRDVVRLPEPVHCRGFRNLWTLPLAIEAAVVAQLASRSR